eukprot:2353645-Prymnesium_polylepis.1
MEVEQEETVQSPTGGAAGQEEADDGDDADGEENAEEDGEENAEEDGESDDYETLQQRVEALEAELDKMAKRAERAKQGYKRKSKPAKPAAAGTEPDEKARAKAQAAHAERVRVSVNKIMDELNARSDIAVEVLNRVILKLSKAQRAELRGLGAMLQERFLTCRHTVNTLKQRCYNAMNSLDLRACEALPFMTMRRVAERLCTELIDGALCRI